MKSTCLFLFGLSCLLTTPNSLHSQWVQTNGPYGGTVYSFAVCGENLYAATSGGVFVSPDNGRSWNSIGLNASVINTIAVNNSILYAGTDNSGVLESSDNGTTWTAMNDGFSPAWMSQFIYAFAFSDSIVYVGTSWGVFLSTNNGGMWNKTALMDTSIFSLAVFPAGTGNSNVYAGTSVGAFRSTDEGSTWTPLSLAKTEVWSFALISNDSGSASLFAASDSGVYLSSDNGEHWIQTSLKDTVVDALAVLDTVIYAGAYGGGIYRSNDLGVTWRQIDSCLTTTFINALIPSGNYLIAGTVSHGAFRSSDGGENWAVSDSGMKSSEVMSVSALGDSLFAGTTGGAFLLANHDAGWTPIGLTKDTVYAFAARGSIIYAGTSDGVFLSTDRGNSWHAAGLTGKTVVSFILSDSNVFAATYGSGVFRSKDGGTSWSGIDTGLTIPYVRALALTDTTLLAGAGQSVVNGGIFSSTNEGTNWAKTAFGNYTVYSLFVSQGERGDTSLYAGTAYGVFLSTDNGKTWTQGGLPSSAPPSSSPVSSFVQSGGSLFCSTRGDGVFLSTDGAKSWSSVGNGLVNRIVRSLVISDSEIYAASVGGGVWRRPLLQLLTGIHQERSLPSKFKLYQNYPNPFNPSTVISYELPVSSRVTLKIYDVLGREIATLFDGDQNAGIHHVTFSAAALSSGVYFYRLQAGPYYETKKLLLLK
jgi:Secretion system C-terminal sorting domain